VTRPLALTLLVLAALPHAARAQQGEDPRWSRLMDASDAMTRAGRFEDALRLAKQAEMFARAISRPPGEMVAASLLSQGQTLEVQRRYPEEAAVLDEALRVARSAYGDRSKLVATVLNNVSGLYFAQGRLTEASRYLQSSIDISVALGDRGSVAVGYGNMAWLQINLRDYRRAEAAVRQSIQIFESLHRTSELAHQYRTLANVRETAGDSATAESVIRRAIALDDTVQRGLNLSAAEDRCQLAGLAETQGRVDEALTLYDHCLHLREQLVPPSDPRYGIIAETLEEMASVYCGRGGADKAIELYRRALEIRSRVFGADSLEAGLAQVRLGIAYWQKGDTQRALATAVVASRLVRAHAVTDRSRQSSLELLAEILLATNSGEYRLKAKEIYEGLAEQQRKGGMWADYGVTLESLGTACVKVGDRACAYGAMRAAVANQQRLYPEPSLKAAYAHVGYAAALYWFHDYAQAAQEFGAAFEQWHRLSGASAESPFSNTDTNVYLDSLWRTRSGDAGRQASEAALSFRITQLSQHNEAARALSQLAARFAAGAGELAPAFRHEQDLTRQLERLRGDYADLLAGTGDADRATKTKNLREQIAAAEQDRDQTRRTLAARVPAYRALAESAVLEPQAVQALLKDGDLLLVFDFGTQGGFVWGIDRHAITWSKIPLTAERLAAEVQALRRGLDLEASQPDRGIVVAPVAHPTTAADLPPFDRSRAYALYQALLGPMKAQLARARHLLFVPAGALQSLPPAVLVTRPPPTPSASVAAYRNTAWLIKDKAITILPSVFTLEALRRIADNQGQARLPFLGVGGPLMNRFEAMKRCSNAVARQQAAWLAPLDDLQDAAKELGSIAHSLGAGDGALLTGARATLASLGSLDLGAYRVLAFATHGLVASGVPGLKEPALVLTPRETCEPDAGLLTASKVSQMHLDADWVVLSACNTASGDGSPNAEGLSGLARAFFYAGARAVLVSHWAVRNEAAVELTTRTFKRLRENPDLGKAAALRSAILDVMNENHRPPVAANPSFWAPFVLVGGD
jgi:CHAT domain-containing protein